MLYRNQNRLLQMVVVICMGVIGGMVYYTYTHIQDTPTIRRDLSDTIGSIDRTCPKGNPSCPSCPSCPKTTCPSAEEIATAVFPGRNTGLTSGGKYFDIKKNGSYELLPEHGFFKAEEAFPIDSILDPPLRAANVSVNQFDNSTGSFNVDTQGSASLTMMNDNNIQSRMNQGITDKNRLKKDLERASESKSPASSRLVDSVQAPETDNEENMRLNMNTRYNLFGTNSGKLYE